MPNHRTIILGDSHTIAVKEAAEREPRPLLGETFVTRFVKVRQDGKMVDGIEESAALEMLAATVPGDIVVSTIGGNQFNTFGMMRHPEPFDFVDRDDPEAPLEPGARIVPLAMIEEAFRQFVRGRDGTLLKKLAAASAVPVFHLEAPPPKGDNEFIERRAETFFRDAGIDSIGVASPALRLKLWRVQGRALAGLCNEIGVRFVASPPVAAERDGCLKLEYYGRDATHANADYGALVLDQIAALRTELVR